MLGDEDVVQIIKRFLQTRMARKTLNTTNTKVYNTMRSLLPVNSCESLTSSRLLTILYKHIPLLLTN